MKTIPIYRGCNRCGMPLHYDALMNGTDVDKTVASALCAHCSRMQSDRRPEYERDADHEWLLDAIISSAHGERTWRHKALSAAKRLPIVGDGSLRTAAAMLDSIPAREPRSTYSAMVLYSGGKDSTYMLVQLAEKGLNVCAWMLDPGYQSPQTLESARRVTAKLGIPLVIERPDKALTDALFRSGFSIDGNSDVDLQKGAMTYGSACWPCFSLIAVSASAFANRHRIPLCFIGTQKGQNRLNLEGAGVLSAQASPKVNDLVARFVQPFRKAIPDHAASLEADPDDIGFPTVLVPYYELMRKPEREIQIAHIERYDWILPKNTGACSSNCMINELGRAVMRSRFGFDLYQVIDANERRLGYAPDQAASGLPDPAIVRLGATMLGLSEQEAAELGVKIRQDSHDA
ncbi:TPA: 7-cyano-7-deazaguanine synthase [Burkholderia aenigmatica]|uniref:7-cyano-7-deazaguanine synthase n=1 Tax=Burkholderia sp. AU45251 TaxID=3059204 RepID=UPI002655BF15|nr:7-cyano-7-deazaguanine synthase [Burkholderia sp. AU45251]HDR9481332.1 7-cyano-7-deazaguanine synthase [Burkholderia aenigmatica]MDN7514046.1 7-cyano-7-deazaguanine synthase [Burkholderia sp. AU45251]HDR9512858.1 7-cyano-7-deazaguanine synthase [Burkholderia aenigmatica]HDR9592843.1 7-cyano-7-deazaguanine synthase [Burkholderia aenigmatica]HDR9598292.1 7-cyano-7-deazaguanine synthase [Burkholderia aenigmatica]